MTADENDRDISKTLAAVAAQIVAYVCDILRGKGFTELGSDALLDNTVSHEAHRGWGFQDIERVVYFRKVIG